MVIIPYLTACTGAKSLPDNYYEQQTARLQHLRTSIQILVELHPI